jgi:hypothetical protein
MVPYVIQDTPSLRGDGEGKLYLGATVFLEYGSRMLIAAQNAVNDHPFILVPGFLLGDIKKGTSQVEVEPVPMTERDQVTQFLIEHHLSGENRFWC